MRQRGRKGTERTIYQNIFKESKIHPSHIEQLNTANLFFGKMNHSVVKQTHRYSYTNSRIYIKFKVLAKNFLKQCSRSATPASLGLISPPNQTNTTVSDRPVHRGRATRQDKNGPTVLFRLKRAGRLGIGRSRC